MPKKTPALEITENTGNRYPDLETVQRLARRALVADLAETIRAMLAAGILEQRDGQITRTVTA